MNYDKKDRMNLKAHLTDVFFHSLEDSLHLHHRVQGLILQYTAFAVSCLIKL
jgi:hypothetical protein